MTTEPEDPFNDETMQELVKGDRYSFGGDTSEVVTPGQANFNATIQSVLAPGAPPSIEDPDDGFVLLPGGLVTDNGVVRSAQVRELTGEDEESIAKAIGNTTRFTNALLKAVVSIGEVPATPKMLGELLVGDREALILGIRCATFGRNVTFESVRCPGCDDLLNITLDLKSIELHELDDPEQREFEVPLRGGVATVRLPNGADSDRVLEQTRTGAEANTVLLSRCVVNLNGKKLNNSLEEARKLGVADRQTLLTFLAEKAPGPRYDEVKSLHESCNTEIPLNLAIDDLFRGF